MASVFVAVDTESGRAFGSVIVWRFLAHLLAVTACGTEQFPLVAPVGLHRPFDAHAAAGTDKQGHCMRIDPSRPNAFTPRSMVVANSSGS